MPDAYFSPPTRGLDIQPFVVAPYGDMQDRVVFGPEEILGDQATFFDWLYNGFVGRDFRSGFRLGWFAGFAVAARIRSIDLQETISNRRDCIAVVGLAAKGASPAALCECLGVVGPIIASRTIGRGYPDALANEADLFQALASFVATTPRDHSWADQALMCHRECEGIPIFRLNLRYRLRKWFARRRAFGALVNASSPAAVRYYIASELWLRSARRNLTILIDLDEMGTASHLLYLDADFRPRASLISVSVRDVAAGASKLLMAG